MRPTVLLLCVLLGACASNDCATNPFELGQRDGVLAANQAERLAARCGGSFDGARYVEGYRDGFSRRPPPLGD